MTRPHSARRRWRSEEGAAAVEFALVVPLLLTLLFGIVEFGAAYNAQIVVTNAAREAARAATVAGESLGEEQLRERAEAAAAAALAPLGGTVSAASLDVTVSGARASTATGFCGRGEQLALTVEVERPLLTGLFGAAFDLTGKATRSCAG